MKNDNNYPPIDLELAERRFKAIRAVILGTEKNKKDSDEQKEKEE